jgi:hypothetical protein
MKRKYYDLPRRMKHRGHRKGVEPPGLKRWRLSQKSHDPGYPSSYWKGARGGHYFQGPHKRRYDPAPRRSYGRVRHFASKAGRGIEGSLNKYGTYLGMALGFGAGIYSAYDKYKIYGKNQANNYLATLTGGDLKDSNDAILANKPYPEIAHLWATNDPDGYNTLPYLQYKFTGKDPTGAQQSSAWVMPFWLSFATWLGSTIGLKIGRLGKLHRVLKPVNKIAKGATIATFIGALALPGCGDHGPGMPPPPTKDNTTVNMQQTSPGHFAQASVPMKTEYAGAY